jgi:cytochrome c-type biogenesis protein CcmH/NrfG
VAGAVVRLDPAGPPGLERRVREHPGDVAAHLTLAERYLDAGRLKEATLEYLAR